MKRYIIRPGDPNANAIRENARREIAAVGLERAEVVEIKPHKERRTSLQNDKWHPMCRELGQTLGYTREEMAQAIKSALGRFTDTSVMLPESLGGGTEHVRVYESSAKWSRSEMIEAIELLNQWAAEVGHRWKVSA
jgi:hypothetical protein